MTFPTKAAKKDALAVLNTKYENLIGYDYDVPFNLCHYRSEKHDAKCAAIAAQINDLFSQREAIMARDVVKPVKAKATDNPLVAQLVAEFAELDATFTKRQIEWALERRAALSALDTTGMNWEQRQRAMVKVAGGSTWLNLISGRNAAMITEEVVKKCDRVIDSRNWSIAKKLEKAEVTEITATNTSYTNNGFHGIYQVATNKGNKRIEIETILAGGYNIQCLHNRTLIKVK